MNNEDIVSLMERYKRELLEFEKRNTAPVSAQEKAEPEPVSAQQKSQAEQVSAQVQEDAEPVNAPAAEPAKAVSAKAKENEAVSAAATVTIQRQTDAQRESQMQFDDGADTDKSQFTPERTQAAGRGDIPQPRTIFVDPQTLKNKNLTSTNTQSAMQRFDEFKSECNKRGILRVETYSSNGLYPVGNSRVVVYKVIDGEKYYIYDSHTDSSGILDNLQLPAPDKSLSETEQGSGGLAPYATYDIFVSHPGFISTYIENVPIFDSTVSIQSVEMLPTVSGEQNPNVINESV